MILQNYNLEDGSQITIREATIKDAQALLEYVEQISSESDNLTFGPGELEMTKTEEESFLKKCQEATNQIYFVGLIDSKIVSSLNFSASGRPRIRHTGEFGMSVLKDHWSIGIGSLLIENLFSWAKTTKVVSKINLRVRTDNENAIHLYEKNGFKKEGIISKAFFVNNKYFDHLCMGYEL